MVTIAMGAIMSRHNVAYQANQVQITSQMKVLENRSLVMFMWWLVISLVL